MQLQWVHVGSSTQWFFFFKTYFHTTFCQEQETNNRFPHSTSTSFFLQMRAFCISCHITGQFSKPYMPWSRVQPFEIEAWFFLVSCGRRQMLALTKRLPEFALFFLQSCKLPKTLQRNTLSDRKSQRFSWPTLKMTFTLNDKKHSTSSGWILYEDESSLTDVVKKHGKMRWSDSKRGTDGGRNGTEKRES